MLKHLLRALFVMLFVFALSSCGGGGGGSDTGGGTITPEFKAQVANAPADGATISGTVRLEVTGNGIENVELLPQTGYTPKYAIFTVSGDKTKATVDFDTTKLSNGGLTVRISAFNAVSGNAVPSEIIAMTVRTWNIDNDQNPVPSTMIMDCAEGAGYQCSGSEILREHGVALTRSGVQVYGKSTNDDITTASGLTVEGIDRGIADMRIRKSGGLGQTLILSNIGISWDGRNERPDIIDTFQDFEEPRRIELQNEIAVDVDLPTYTNVDFFNFDPIAKSGSQEHYANNRYFPREPGNPPRSCVSNCENTEILNTTNNFENGLTHTGVSRLHGDGDVHAGNRADGSPLPNGDGLGVPFPGSKGYREFHNWAYQYGNLTAWTTQDTVYINEWVRSDGTNEHNQMRRGILAFGDTTAPDSVPTSGTITYSGFVYGWYAGSQTATEQEFNGNAEVTVNFSARTVVVRIMGIPSTDILTVTTTLKSGGNANYLNDAVNNATWNGGLSGRLFGPASTEIGGAFSLTSNGRTAIGGFIARH